MSTKPLRENGKSWIRTSREAGKRRACKILSADAWLREFRIMVAKLSDHRQFHTHKEKKVIDDALRQRILRIACERMGFNFTFQEEYLESIRQEALDAFEAHMVYLERFCTVGLGVDPLCSIANRVTSGAVNDAGVTRSYGISLNAELIFGSGLRHDRKQHAFYWHVGLDKLSILSLLEGTDSSIVEASSGDGGVLVGTATKYNDQTTDFDVCKPVLWKADQDDYSIQELDRIPDSDGGTALRITADGGFAGGMCWKGSVNHPVWMHITFWDLEGGKVQDLGAFPGTTTCEVSGIARDRNGNVLVTGECRQGTLGNYAWIKSFKWSSIDGKLVDMGYL